MAKIAQAKLIINVSKIAKDEEKDSFSLDGETILLISDTLDAIFADKNVVVELFSE